MALVASRAPEDVEHLAALARRTTPGPVVTRVAPWPGELPTASSSSDLSRRLRSLSEAQQQERSRIARELHDVVGQALTAVRLSLMSAREAADPAQLEERLATGLELVDSALADVRSIAYDLRPAELDDLGLIAAVRSCLARQERASGVRMVLRAPRVSGADLGVETAAYRIVQEAVTNVVRHASAHRVVVHLRVRESELRVDIADDGVGFGVREALAAPGSIGLAGMYERAWLAGGGLEIGSAPGRGTRVRARFPVRPLA